MRTRRDLGAALGVAASLLAATAAGADGLSAERKAELANLLRQDCGACHGLTRKGGLGPPLSTEALEGRSVDGLTAVIFHGVPGTAMPPWKPLLSHAEAAWLARQLKEANRE